jgi:hypothetical protein
VPDTNAREGTISTTSSYKTTGPAPPTGEVVALIDAAEPAHTKRGPYSKRLGREGRISGQTVFMMLVLQAHLAH